MSVLRRGPVSRSDDTAVVAEGPVTSTAALSPAWRREAACSSDFPASSPSFADIVRDELLQIATIEHTANKSLALIQVEAS